MRATMLLGIRLDNRSRARIAVDPHPGARIALTVDPMWYLWEDLFLDLGKRFQQLRLLRRNPRQLVDPVRRSFLAAIFILGFAEPCPRSSADRRVLCES